MGLIERLRSFVGKGESEDYDWESVIGPPDRMNFSPHKIQQAVVERVKDMKKKIPELWKGLPEEQKKIIEEIAELEKIELFQVAAEWLVQKKIFSEWGKYFKLKSAESFSKSQQDGFIVLTGKGSLLTATEPDKRDKSRRFQYLRIPSRSGSWEKKGESTSFTGQIVEDVSVGSPARVPTIKTSPVQGILVVPKQRIDQLPVIVQTVTEGVFAVTSQGEDES